MAHRHDTRGSASAGVLPYAKRSRVRLTYRPAIGFFVVIIPTLATMSSAGVLRRALTESQGSEAKEDRARPTQYEDFMAIREVFRLYHLAVLKSEVFFYCRSAYQATG